MMVAFDATDYAAVDLRGAQYPNLPPCLQGILQHWRP